jgi:hypothetical protein
MILDILLAFAMVAASATQLHLPGSDFTFGEISLAIWVALNAIRLMLGQPFVISRAFVSIAIFWSGIALALSIGSFVGYFSEILYANYLAHDSIAYVLLALFTFFATSMPNAPAHFRQVSWLLILFASVSLAIQITIAYAFPWSIASQAWFWDRFQGWSTNPNQLALYCAAYWPIALHLFVTSVTRRAKLAAFAGMIMPIAAGILTRSDTFLLTSIFAFLLFIPLHILWQANTNRPYRRQNGRLAALTFAGVAAIIISAWPYVDEDFTTAVQLSKSIVREKGSLTSGEASGRRLALIDEAIQKSLLAGSLGLGPGPHLESRPLNEPNYRASRFEAHNTYLDLYTQGGLMAVLLFLGTLTTAAASAWRARMAALFSLVTVLAVFAIPHLIIRHPILWYSICLCIVTGMASTPFHLPRTRRLALGNRPFLGA